MPRRIFSLSLLAGALWFSASQAQTPFPGARPAATPAAAAWPAPREVPLIEKQFEQLSNTELSEDGRKALQIDPQKWHHAETDNFIVHYRRVTEAQKVVREVEYTLWYVATVLGATREQATRKSHIYVFEDEAQWQQFLALSQNQMKWAASYAHGDELFLNVRGSGNTAGSSFDSQTLAHEATHAVVARLFPRQQWPLWLNEGFAEYMGGASSAARKGQGGRRYQRQLQFAEMPLSTLAQMDSYPADEMARAALYQSSEKLIRFLMTEFPRERIVGFIQAIVGGAQLPEAITSVYGDKVKDFSTFQRRYERFAR